MNKRTTDSFSLEGIFAKRGIPLKDENGNQRDIVDILEDMYLRLDQKTLCNLFFEIGEEEDMGNNIFQEARQ